MSLNNNHISYVSALSSLANAPVQESKRHHSVVVRNNMQSIAIRNPVHTASNTQALTIVMHANRQKAQTRVDTQSLCAEETWNLLSAVDTFVCLATSAVYAAYQKLAARIFTRCTLISILKLYVTDTACIAKWRLLKHNDYETIIIWRSTRGGPHPKCSLHAVYKGPRKSSRTNLQKKLSLSPCLLVSPPIFIVSPSQQ